MVIKGRKKVLDSMVWVMELEEKFYPEHGIISQARSLGDVEEAFVCIDMSEAFIITNESKSFYVAGSCHSNEIEVANMAGRMSLVDISMMVEDLKKIAGGKEIHGEFRDSTSWRLLKAFEKKGLVSILEEEEFILEEGDYHDAYFEFV